MRNFALMSGKRNISTLFLAVLYLSLSVGVAIKSHYCHGQLSSISYAITPDCECEDEGAEMSCCSTVEQFIQLDEKIVLPKEVLPVYLTEQLLVFQGFLLFEEFDTESPINQEYTASEQEVYLLFHKLILYA